MTTLIGQPLPRVEDERWTTRSCPRRGPRGCPATRTDAAKRCKRVDRATVVIWKLLLVGEQRLPRLKAPHLLREVYWGAVYEDGRRVKRATAGVAA